MNRLGGKRWVFSLEVKIGNDREVRIERGKEFHMVGAEKEKDLRPRAVLMKGTSSK
jgi:hypothetical protein